MSSRVTANVPDKIRSEAEILAANEERSLSNLIVYLLKKAIKDAKADGMDLSSEAE